MRRGIVLLVVNNKKEILVLKQIRNNTFSFISGGIEKDETPIDAAVREAKEEISLGVDPKKLINTGRKIKFTGSRKGIAQQFVFLYKLNSSQQLKPDQEEISEFFWASRNEAINLLKNKPPLVRLIKDLQELLGE